MARLDALTGMRGVASLLVVGFHAVLVLWFAQLTFGWEPDAFARPLSAWLFGGGWLGVDFFFVLSGFLLARPLLAAATELPSWPGYRLFLAKRLLRIVPPYYASFLVVYALAGWSGHVVYATSAKDIVLHALYLHTFFPEHQLAFLAVAWTLALELQFYLVLPLFVLPFRRWGPAAALPYLGVSLAYLAAVQDPDDFFRSRFLSFQLPSFLGHFAFGVAAAQLHDAGRWPRLHPDAVIAIAAALLLVLPAVVLGYTNQFEVVDAFAYTVLLRPAAGLAFAIVILAALQRGSRVGRAFTWRPLTWAGDVSYSLYLVHLAVGGFFLVNGWRWPFEQGLTAFMLLMTTASLAVAWLLYQAVERPSLRLKEAVASRLERAGPA